MSRVVAGQLRVLLRCSASAIEEEEVKTNARFPLRQFPSSQSRAVSFEGSFGALEAAHPCRCCPVSESNRVDARDEAEAEGDFGDQVAAKGREARAWKQRASRYKWWIRGL